jgi:uncharacterized tellurite resistance protein B-like protein
MDVEQRTNICRLIEAVIAADGVIKPQEQAFLRRIAQRFRIPYDIIGVGPVSDCGPVSHPGRASSLLRQLPHEVQMSVMALLVDSAVTDGEVHPEEHALLLVAAAALGVDAAALEERVNDRLKRVTNPEL